MFSSALKKASYAQALYTSRPDQIFLVRGRDSTGERAWYYVMVDRTKRDSFKSRSGVPFMNIGDYGNVIHSGYGDNPPEDIIAEMKEEYGFSEAA